MAPSLVPLMHTPLTGPGHNSKNPPDTARLGANKNPRSRGMTSNAGAARFHAIPREDGGFKKILPHEDCPESSARGAFRPILMRLMSLSRISPETYRIIRQAPDSASLYAFGKNAFPKFREFRNRSVRRRQRTFGTGSRRRAPRRAGETGSSAQYCVFRNECQCENRCPRKGRPSVPHRPRNLYQG